MHRAQVAQEQQARLGAVTERFGGRLRVLRLLRVLGGCREVEAVRLGGLGQPPDVLGGPAGEVGGDVVDLVVGAVPFGQRRQLPGEPPLAVVEGSR